jgi:hypothetical protein
MRADEFAASRRAVIERRYARALIKKVGTDLLPSPVAQFDFSSGRLAAKAPNAHRACTLPTSPNIRSPDFILFT